MNSSEAIRHTEQELIEQVKAGNDEAFCKWVEEYKQKAINIAYSFCRNYEDAKDLSQEAFIKAYKKMRGFKGDSTLYTWFYRILVNKCKDHLRSKKSNRTFSFCVRRNNNEDGGEFNDLSRNIASNNPGPKKELLNKELKEHLNEAISTLPEKQKIVFTLRNIHGMTILEISKVTRCATGTVKAHLFKATANLRKRLGGYFTGGVQ